nr:methyltransferase protein 10 [Hymenolepis microstoma]
MDDLQPSTLGSKEYWDDHYDIELKNFEQFEDEGDIWFGVSSEERIIKYLASVETPKDVRILDLGCGNGHFCLELTKRGYSSVTGVDYSENAINLAFKLAEKHDLCDSLNFTCVDILSTESINAFSPSSDNAYDIAIDKGTFDAITLIPDATDPTRICEKSRDIYIQHTYRLLRPDATFIITSCNWSADELRQEFARPQTTNKAVRKVFEFVCEVPPISTFSFGGRTGASTVCLVFKRLELPSGEQIVTTH